jgi:hypothetical protein
METLFFAPAPNVGEGRLIAIEGKAPPEKATGLRAETCARVRVTRGAGMMQWKLERSRQGSSVICRESFKRLSRDAIRAINARVVTLLSEKKQLIRHSPS